MNLPVSYQEHQQHSNIDTWVDELAKDNLFRSKNENKDILKTKAMLYANTFQDIPYEHLSELFDLVRKTHKFTPTIYDIQNVWNDEMLPKINRKKVGDFQRQKQLESSSNNYDVNLKFADINLWENFQNVDINNGHFVKMRQEQHEHLTKGNITRRILIKKIADIESQILHILALRDGRKYPNLWISGVIGQRTTADKAKINEEKCIVQTLECGYGKLYTRVVEMYKANENPYKMILEM